MFEIYKNPQNFFFQSTKISKIFISMDLLQSHIQQNQNYFLFRYLPYALISIHFICAMHVSRRLKFDMNTQLFNNFVLPKVEPKIHQQASQIVKIKPNNLTGFLNFFWDFLREIHLPALKNAC